MLKPVKRDYKKPYSSPIITVYGTVQELTQKVSGLRGNNDGGRFPRGKTARLAHTGIPGQHLRMVAITVSRQFLNGRFVVAATRETTESRLANCRSSLQMELGL